MFDNEYFPTPDKVIKQMLEPYLKKDKIRLSGYTLKDELPYRAILEPQAGEGYIIEYLCTHTRFSSEIVFACETNETCQAVLRSKKHASLIESNFLNLSPGQRYFDFIIMNPPFSNADEHILHGWECLFEGDLVSLCNAETIHNPYSARRKELVALIEKHGSVEFIGKAFDNAERKTSIEVAIVRLHKPKKFIDFDFDIPTLQK